MQCTCQRGKKPCESQATKWVTYRTQVREGWKMMTERAMCDDHVETTLKVAKNAEVSLIK